MLFYGEKMIAVIISLVVHAVLTLGVFGFTYGMYVATQDLNMLHLLWLLLAVWFFAPTYEYKRSYRNNEKDDEEGE